MYLIDKTANNDHNPIVFIQGNDYLSSDWNIMKSRFLADGWNSSYLVTGELIQSCDVVAKAEQINMLIMQKISRIQIKLI